MLAQIVAEELGLAVEDVRVDLELDTAKDAWSIAAGTYSCRFSPGTAVAAHKAARTIRARLTKIAAKQLNMLADDIEFAGGKIRSRRNPDNALSFAPRRRHGALVARDAARGRAAALRETAVWAPPELEPPSADDRINTSLTYGFVFDFCGVEIDPATYAARVDRYVSMHDAGRILNPMLAEGQVRGAFAQGLAAALYEEFLYDDQGAFLTGTFADYLVPTAMEIPPLEDPAHPFALAADAVGRQGPRRGQLHEHARLHRQRHRRRARHRGRDPAGDAAPPSRADDGAAVSGELVYPFEDYPPEGSAREVADGVFWLSTPMPFAGLRQVNLWLVRDGDGWTMVDCGYAYAAARAAIAATWESVLGGRPVTRLVITHFHPDHAGNSAWIAERWGVRPLMTQAEWFAAQIALRDKFEDAVARRIVFFREHGLDEARIETFAKGAILYSAGVELPPAFTRIKDGDELSIGADRWTVSSARAIRRSMLRSIVPGASC